MNSSARPPRRLSIAALPRAEGEPPLVTGLCRFAEHGAPRLALVVKAAFTYAEGQLEAMDAPAPLRASDFVPPKQDAEVIVTGSDRRTDASVDVDGITATFKAAGAVVPPEDGLPLIMPGAHVTLSGLSRGGRPTAFDLPDLSPRAAVERRNSAPATIDLVCDTLSIDAEREVLELCWRGSISEASAIDHVLVFWSHAAAPRGIDDARGHLAHAALSYALEERDLAGGQKLDALEEADLLRAKAAAWKHPAKPMLPIERYAAIAAELQEKRDPAPQILRRHGLTEEGFPVEERAWLEAMAEGAMQGDALVAGRFGEAFLAAQDALAAPDEAARTADDWVPVKADLSRGADPAKALPLAGMTLPVWMRLDRRIAAAARKDAALAADLDARVAAAAEAMGELEDEPIDMDLGAEEG